MYNIITVTTAEKRKHTPRILTKEIESGKVSSFPFLQSFNSENEIQLDPELAANIKEHCDNLIADFNEYFLENLTSEFWIWDPVSIGDILPESLTTNEKD
jgi:hypothetical protein